MDVPSASPPLKIKSSKNINPFGLDKNIAHLISGYLTRRDLLNLCLASKGFHSIFHPSLEKRLMPVFLKYVVEGRLDKVEEVLNRNQKLVFLQGDIIDLSGREFKRITAFQYATWALDKEMWELILKYLPEAKAYEQRMSFEQKRPDITEVHGKRFNFQPLLTAYDQYTTNYEAWKRDPLSWAQCENCWCTEVGGAQYQMPAWFVYVFCEEGYEKAWPKKDFNQRFNRFPRHLRKWFDGEFNGVPLRSKGGFYREVDWCSNLSYGGDIPPHHDRSAVFQCMSDRTNDLLKFIERLSEIYGGNKKFLSYIHNSWK